MTRNKRIGLIALVLIVGLFASCSPGTILVETNYEIDQPLTASVGQEMVVIEKVRQTSTGSQLLQAMGDEPVISSFNFISTEPLAKPPNSVIF